MWEIVSLKDLCTVFDDGDWIETKDQSYEGIRLIQTGNIKVGRFAKRSDKSRYISDATFKRLNCTEVKEGAILVSRLPDPVGRACLVPALEGKAITAVDCTIIRTNDSTLPQYLNYYLQSPEYFSLVQGRVTGATRQRISRKNLGDIPIKIPPLPEQKRIVERLDKAFAEIDKVKTAVWHGEGNNRGLVNAAVRAVLSDKRFGWEYENIESISENLDSMRMPISKSKRVSGGVPYYGASGVVDYVEGSIFDENLLLISEDGANLLMRTYPIAYSISGKSWVNNHAHVLRFSNMEIQRWVEYYLNATDLKTHISGMAQPKLNQKKLNALPVPLPQERHIQDILGIIEVHKQVSEEMACLYAKKELQLKNLVDSILRQELTPEKAA